MFNIIQSGGLLGNDLGNLSKKLLLKLVPLAEDVFPKLGTKEMNLKEKSGKAIIRAGKGVNLFISNEDIYDIN